jgi:hypothetical protein
MLLAKRHEIVERLVHVARFADDFRAMAAELSKVQSGGAGALAAIFASTADLLVHLRNSGEMQRSIKGHKPLLVFGFAVTAARREAIARSKGRRRRANKVAQLMVAAHARVRP